MVRITLFLLAFLFSPSAVLAATVPTVDSVLNYVSLRVHPAETTGPFGFEYEARMTTDEFEINNELAIAPDNSPYEHSSFYIMTDPSSFEDLVLYVEVHVPLTNRNGNGTFDFYEYGQSVTATTTGRFSTDGQNGGPVNVGWNRAASNSVGTLTLNFPTLGLTFNHAFEVLEYRGTYTYIRDGSNLTGTNVMTRMGFPTETIHGSLNAVVVSTNLIAWDDGSASWQDQDRGGITFVPVGGFMERFTNVYVDAIFFEDGYRPTSASDFQLAIFTLRDTRDQNNNGIPDLTDPNTTPSPIAPRLSIKVQGDALLLTITGTAGAVYDIESSASVSRPSWVRQQTITMPAATHEIIMPRPTTLRAFWRIRVR
jgi:hypothetical protein